MLKDSIKKFIPLFLLNWYHFFLAFLGAVIFGFPSRKLKVIGVTGTNGKSTVVELSSKVLEEAGYKVAALSSIKFKVADKEWQNMFKMTMPGRFVIQKILRQAVRAGCQYFVLEVTSEGILQHRHRFIDFEGAVFTNLSPEHIEAHGSFENYRSAKGKLFQAAKKNHIINIDDQNAEYFIKFPSKKKFCYSLKGNPKTGNWKIVKAVGLEVSGRGTEFLVDKIQFRLKLLASFNAYNALAAICLGLSQGIGLEICKKALEKAEGIPGRMEEVISEPFKVFVDYAVTPDALESLYQAIKRIFSPKRMIAVFGSCGGGRDKWKRPVLGEIAAKHCDEIILTNEDPYDENPGRILEDIEKGILKIQNSKLNKNLKLKIAEFSVHLPSRSALPEAAIKNYEKILERREAIRKSLKLAKPNDIVIITGKGCEPWICAAGGKKIPWEEKNVIREEFGKLQKKTASR